MWSCFQQVAGETTCPQNKNLFCFAVHELKGVIPDSAREFVYNVLISTQELVFPC